MQRKIYNFCECNGVASVPTIHGIPSVPTIHGHGFLTATEHNVSAKPNYSKVIIKQSMIPVPAAVVKGGN